MMDKHHCANGDHSDACPMASRKRSSPEDPDEWVVQDRVPVRTSCDQVMWVKDGESNTGFSYSFRNSASDGRMHGYTAPSGYQLHVRCRRRDLPKVEQPEQCAAKPPIGIMPRRLWLEQRRDDLRDAITRYEAAGRAVASEWRSEEASIQEELRDKPQPAKTRVRLWMRNEPKGRPSLFACDERPYPDTDKYIEIHHDEHGFYTL